MLKNKQIYILILLFCASMLSLYSMEQAPTKVPGLQNFLNLQQTRLHKYLQDAIKMQMSPTIETIIVQQQIDNAQEQLNQNTSPYFYVRDLIGQISINLNNLNREVAYEQGRLNRLFNKNKSVQKSITVAQPIISTPGHVENLSPQPERLSIPNNISHIQDEYLQEATPQQVVIAQNRGVDLLHDTMQTDNTQERITTAQQTIIPESHVENLSPQPKKLFGPKRSKKPKSVQRQPVDLGPKFDALKRFLTYFNGAAICTGIGLYSYYKLPEQLQWCRPALIGLSVFGGATCSILAYKNLKTLISKKTY